MDEVSATAQSFLEDRTTATLGNLFEDGSPQALMARPGSRIGMSAPEPGI